MNANDTRGVIDSNSMDDTSATVSDVDIFTNHAMHLLCPLTLKMLQNNN